MHQKQHEEIDISNIHYQEPLAKYIDLAYRTLRMRDKKLPAESRMKVPLTVMFIIHNRDVFGYTTVKEFELLVSRLANISLTSVRDRVLGGYMAAEYVGLKYIFYKFLPYRDHRSVSVMWYNRPKRWRYEYMIDVERRLTDLMQEEAEKNFEDISVLRIKEETEEQEEF